jgi:glyoxylase-like metal-dependent hydrolase (beta-lactamase superfamily II)
MAKIEVLTAGHCCSFARLGRRCDPWRWASYPAAFGLILPRGGAPVLFDTGYSRHVFPAMAGFPFRLYRALLPITLGVDAVEQLGQRGIAPEDVGMVVISHFHPDHIGGLRDFPQARFVCSRRAWEDVRGRTGFAALRRGFLAKLLPSDFEERAIFAEDLPDGLMLGEERVTLLPLDGHVPGQLGLRLLDESGRSTLFAADAAWRSASLSDGIGPHPLAMRVHHDRAAYARTLAGLVRMRRAEPELRVVLTHDAGETSC